MESKKRALGKKQQPGEIRKHRLERGIEDSERVRGSCGISHSWARRVEVPPAGVHRPDFKEEQVGKKGREWVLKDQGV